MWLALAPEAGGRVTVLRREEKEISPVERGKVSPVLTRSARRRLVLTESTGNQQATGTQKLSPVALG